MRDFIRGLLCLAACVIGLALAGFVLFGGVAWTVLPVASALRVGFAGAVALTVLAALGALVAWICSEIQDELAWRALNRRRGR